MKIGIIGAGNIGGTLGKQLAAAGHTVRFGVRNQDRLAPLLAEIGQAAGAGTPRSAVEFADVLVFAGPFGLWPDFATEFGDLLAGKVVIDAANPYPARDGAVAEAATRNGEGSAVYVARLLPNASIVKSFNTVYWVDLRDQAGRVGEKLAMPMAGDDSGALSVTGDLARDAGYDPVIVGGLDRSCELDPGSRIYAKSLTAAQVRTRLGLGGSHQER